jgi:hypothetical protein
MYSEQSKKHPTEIEMHERRSGTTCGAATALSTNAKAKDRFRMIQEATSKLATEVSVDLSEVSRNMADELQSIHFDYAVQGLLRTCAPVRQSDSLCTFAPYCMEGHERRSVAFITYRSLGVAIRCITGPLARSRHDYRIVAAYCRARIRIGRSLGRAVS